MTLKEIVEAVQNYTKKTIDIDFSILEKDANQLSLSETQLFIERTKISLDFLATGTPNNSMDREVTYYWAKKERLERLSVEKQEMIDYIKSNYHKELNNFDFICPDNKIDYNQLLKFDDYELFNIVFEKYKIDGMPISLHQDICDRLSNRTLTDYRFANFCINDDAIATRALNILDRPGFDSTIDNLKSIILLIENGGVVTDSQGEGYYSSKYFITSMLKDYCCRKLIELENA